MPSEPINPQDHSIVVKEQGCISQLAGFDVGDFDSDGNPDFYARSAFKLALHEAIHQTFERDTHYDPNDKTGLPDPDTDIDRLARLIVDGEYRRRLSQQQGES